MSGLMLAKTLAVLARFSGAGGGGGGERPPTANLLQNYRIATAAATLAGVETDGSGCTYNDLTNTLFVLGSNGVGRSIFELDPTTLAVLREITTSGYTDPEGLCWMTGTSYAVIDEGSQTGAITIVTIDAGTTSIAKPSSGANYLTTNASSYAIATGWEGIAYDPTGDVFYGVIEKAAGGGNGVRVFSINKTTGNVTELTTLNTALSAIMTDASDCFWSRTRGTLFVLSHESDRVAECDVGLQTIISHRAIPDMTQAEGVAFRGDMTKMWLVGEVSGLTPQVATMEYTGGTLANLNAWSDDFNDNSLDTGKWAIGSIIGSYNASETVAEANARLEIQPSGTATRYGGIQANAPIDPRGLSMIARLDLSAAMPVAAGFVIRFGYALDANNYVCFTTDCNGTTARLRGRRVNAGVASDSTVATYNATNHAWLRLRISANGATAFFDSAPDVAGSPGAWTNTFVSRPVGTAGGYFSVASLTPFALAGQSAAVTTPPQVRFDRLYLEVT